MRVLVIDDDELIRRSLRRLLSEYEVDTVAGGAEALAALDADDRRDAILCDVMMPGLTGQDVLDTIRRRHPQLVAHFGFMTGSLSTPLTQRLLSGGRRPCVEKPVERAVLIALIERLRSGVPDADGHPS